MAKKMWILSTCVYLTILICFSPINVRAQSDTTSTVLGEISQLSAKYPDSAYTLLKQRIARAREENDRITEAAGLQKAGQLLYHEGNYGPAINNLMEAGSIFQEEGKIGQLGQTLNDLGIVYYYNRQPDKAMRQFNKALILYKGLKDNRGIAESYGQIGHLYEKKMTYDSAFYYQKLALSHLGEISDSAGIATIYENIASIMEDQELYDSSLYYYKASLRLTQHYGHPVDQIELINNLGDIYRKTGRYELGLLYAKQAMLMSAYMNEQYQLGSAYRDIGRSFAMMKQYDSAYFYIEQARVLQKQIYKIENIRQISLLQVHYDTEKKNLEIIRLHAEKQVNFIVTTASIIILILLLFVSFLIYKRQKTKTKTEKEMREAQKHIYQTENGLLETELENKKLEEARLKQQLEVKSKELSTHILHLIQKNEALEVIKKDLNELLKGEKRDHKKDLKQLLHNINISINQDTYWQEFRTIFEQVHQSFFDKVRSVCSELTANDLRLIALLKMNLHSSDITTLLGVSPDSLRVIRYRLRKKLKLEQGVNLSSFLQSL